VRTGTKNDTSCTVDIIAGKHLVCNYVKVRIRWPTMLRKMLQHIQGNLGQLRCLPAGSCMTNTPQFCYTVHLSSRDGCFHTRLLR
jgi:hypothetical protein